MSSTNISRNTTKDWIILVECFINKSIGLILKERINIEPKTNSEKLTSQLGKFHFFAKYFKTFLIDTEKMKNETVISKISEEDEYSDLKPIIENTNTSLHRMMDLVNEKKIILNIYFERRNVKFIVETWSFTVKINKNASDKINWRKLLLLKKLSVMIRTFISLTKLLPIYSMLVLRGFDFKFQFNIENYFTNDVDVMNRGKNENEKITMRKMNFANYSDSVGSIKIEVHYMNKNEIFEKEGEILKQLVREGKNIYKRSRVLSDTDKNLVVKQENPNHIQNLEVKRVTRSVENYPYNNNNFKISLSTTENDNRMSSHKNSFLQKLSDTYLITHKTESTNVDSNDSKEAKILLSQIFANNEDFSYKKNALKIINSKFKQMNFDNVSLQSPSKFKNKFNEIESSPSDCDFEEISCEEYSDSEFELQFFNDDSLKEELTVDIYKSFINLNKSDYSYKNSNNYNNNIIDHCKPIKINKIISKLNRLKSELDKNKYLINTNLLFYKINIFKNN